MAVIEINNPITDSRTGTSAGTPASGTFGAGVRGIGALVRDTTNGKLFINSGTLASPTWTVVGSQT